MRPDEHFECFSNDINHHNPPVPNTTHMPTLPTPIDVNTVLAWLGSWVFDIGDGLGSWVLRDGNAWQVRVCRPPATRSGAALVNFKRFVADPNTPILWHVRARDCGRTLVFLSADESVLGRCSTVGQGPNETAHVTIIDNRITAPRVCQLISAIASCGSKPPRLVDLSRAIQSVVSVWPSAPQAEAPNLAVMAVGAPGPVSVPTQGSVSVAGGRILVRMETPDTIARIMQFQRERDMFDDSVFSPLVRACLEGGGIGKAAYVILVSQHGECDVAWQEWVHDDVSRSFTAASGAMVAQVFFGIYTIYACMQMDASEVLQNVPTLEDILLESTMRADYVNAVGVIRRFALEDRCVRRAKEIAWRPSGTLVANMMTE